MEIRWPLTFDFITTHHRECGRPRYVKAILLYGESCYGIQSFLEKIGLPDWAIWRLVGVRVLMCVTCEKMAFTSRFSAHILYAMFTLKQMLFPGHDGSERLLFDEDDIMSFSEDERKRLGIELAD